MLINLIAQQSDRRVIEPIQTFVSVQSAITLGVPINFTHNWLNFDPLTQTVLLTGILICTSSDRGYVLGDVVTPDRGISYQITSTELIARPDDRGVYVMRVDNGRSAKIDPQSWDFMLKALVI